MTSDFRTALKNRHSYYAITNESPVSDAAIQDIVQFAIQNTPSAFNSQSARVVLLLDKEHRKFWDIVRGVLRTIVPAASFQPTDDKLNSFAAGHGTVLFFEDQQVIATLQETYPLYTDHFPIYSANSTGMLQFVTWVMLCDAGLGASLQHYGNLVQNEVAETWNLDKNWILTAQMPFGKPVSEAEVKEKMPIEQCLKVFS